MPEKNCNIVWIMLIMDNKNTVLHILWSGRAGGAERFVRDIVIHADTTSFEHVVCFLSHGGSFAAAMQQSGVKTHCLNMKTGFSIARGVRLRGFIKRIAPHIIQSHCRSYVANTVITRLARPRKIYFEHGSDLIAQNQKREIRFYNRLGRYYDLIMANSHYTRDRILELTGVDAHKVIVFYIGIDHGLYNGSHRENTLRQKLGFTDNDTVVGTIGRLVEQKGIDDFVMVAAELAKLHRSCRFVVVGEGHKRAELERMANAKHVDVMFLGERLDVPSIIRTFDLFLFTPKWEPFGIVVLEAMAASVPVVGYSVPGMKEIIDRGGGVLVTTRDPHVLARTAMNILTNREEYAKVQRAGLRNVRANFDIRERIKKLEALYSKLVSTT